MICLIYTLLIHPEVLQEGLPFLEALFIFMELICEFYLLSLTEGPAPLPKEDSHDRLHRHL